MKTSKLSTRLAGITLAAASIAFLNLGPVTLRAEEKKSTAPEETFASPDEAVNALKEATKNHDRAAWDRIFGPGANLILTGDKVQDENHLTKFGRALDKCHQTQEGDNKIVLEVGDEQWPFPIPLVKQGDRWRFDTDAGKEEIIDRHIGRDELNAIGVCRAYVDAQRQYASMNSGQYATKFRSSPGTKDGLYWENSDGQLEGPLAALATHAHAEGYGQHHDYRPHPFHGYYFRILTRQGADASGGKMDYMDHGKLTKGFALVAYPEHWDQSGIMTFIVNQDGKVLQCNLGEKSKSIGASMKEYNPGSEWTPVQEQGEFEKED